VSLSPPDRLQILLAPSRVHCARVTGARNRLVQAASLGCAGSADGELWRAPLNALGRLLAASSSRAASCTVTLSSTFVRYVMLPWQPALRDEAEALAAARHAFEERYGRLMTASWEVELSRAAYGLPRLACATDRALVEGIRAACDAANVSMAGMRPLLSAAFDHWRSHCKEDRYWFAVVEPGRLSLARIADGGCRAVHTQRTMGHPGAELEAMIARDSVAAPAAAGERLYVCSPQARLGWQSLYGSLDALVLEAAGEAPMERVELERVELQKAAA
jgi:hypothetical protein